MRATKRPPTRQVRIAGDLAEMLSEIAAYDLISGVRLLDPLIRSDIEARFAKLPKSIREQAMARIASLSNR